MFACAYLTELYIYETIPNSLEMFLVTLFSHKVNCTSTYASSPMLFLYCAAVPKKLDKAALSLIMKTDTLDCVVLKQSATLIRTESWAPYFVITDNKFASPVFPGNKKLFHTCSRLVLFMPYFFPGSRFLISRLIKRGWFTAQNRKETQHFTLILHWLH